MILSDKGIAALRLSEGLELKPYSDIGGKTTIGIGHLLTPAEKISGIIYIDSRPVKWRNGISEEQAIVLCKQDVKISEEIIKSLVKIPLKQYQFDSLINFVFNIGVLHFQHSTLLRVLNEGHYDQAPQFLILFVYCNHKIDDGLANRRKREVAMWNGIYPTT